MRSCVKHQKLELKQKKHLPENTAFTKGSSMCSKHEDVYTCIHTSPLLFLEVGQKKLALLAQQRRAAKRNYSFLAHLDLRLFLGQNNVTADGH